MLIQAKNKVTGRITLLPEKYLKFNKNYKKATKADLNKEGQQEEPTNVATEEETHG